MSKGKSGSQSKGKSAGKKSSQNTEKKNVEEKQPESNFVGKWGRKKESPTKKKPVKPPKREYKEDQEQLS